MGELVRPPGCPWDREQSNLTLRRQAIERSMKLIDAIGGGRRPRDGRGIGDLLLKCFHCQLPASAVHSILRKFAACSWTSSSAASHVFGTTKVKNVEMVWANWEKFKKAEKHGTRTRAILLGRIPKHLPACCVLKSCSKKAHKAKNSSQQAEFGRRN